MRYLTVKEVEAINQYIILSYSPNEQVGVKDRSMLESAVNRPKASAFGEDAYPTIETKAAALFESLAQNHPFHNANKRTAFISLTQFLYPACNWQYDPHLKYSRIREDWAGGQLPVNVRFVRACTMQVTKALQQDVAILAFVPLQSVEEERKPPLIEDSLYYNGYDFEMTTQQVQEDFTVDVVNHKVAFEQITSVIKEYSFRLD